MKTIFLSIICLFTIYTGMFDSVQEFHQNVTNGYEYFMYLTDNEIVTENYTLKVVAGVYEEKEYYSIYFSNAEPNTYDIALKLEGTEKYIYPIENSRGDSLIYFLRLEKNLIVEIRYEGTATNSTIVEIVDFEKVDERDLVTGLNQGLETSVTLNKKVNPVIYTLSIVFSGIIVVCIIILSIVLTSKKGMFNKEKFNKEFKKEHEVRDQIQEFIKEQNKVIEVEAEEVQEAPKEVYQKQDKYSEEERDISELLSKKGFNTNYSELSTDEKNQVMLELMKMKNFNEITEAEYKSEAIKLWM